jgi:hypothetical protein
LKLLDSFDGGQGLPVLQHQQCPLCLIPSGGGYFTVGNAALNGWTFVLANMNISSTAYQHGAVVGDGTNIKVYRDGSLIATTPHPNWASASWLIQLGKEESSYSNGGMDEFLLYDDVLWTSNFTPPDAPFSY